MEKLDYVLGSIGLVAPMVGLVVIADRLDSVWASIRSAMGLSAVHVIGFVVVGLFLLGVTKELFR